MSKFIRTRLAAGALVGVAVLAACGGEDSPAVGGGATTTTGATQTTQATATTIGATTTTTGDIVISVTVSAGSTTVAGSPGICDQGRQRCSVPRNRRVTLMVASDVADEIHVHAYDLHVDVGPGRPGTLSFDATIPGVVEVELEAARRLLFSLAVT